MNSLKKDWKKLANQMFKIKNKIKISLLKFITILEIF